MAKVSEFLTIKGEKPRCHESFEALKWLVGKWRVNGDFYPFGYRLPNHPGVMEFRPVNEGRFLRMDLTSWGPLAYYEAQMLFTWAAGAQAGRGVYTDGYGLMDGLTWYGSDGSAFLNFDSGFTFLGPIQAQRLTFERDGDGLLSLVEIDRGEGWKPLIVQRGTRVDG